MGVQYVLVFLISSLLTDVILAADAKGEATVGSITCKWIEIHGGSKRGISIYRCTENGKSISVHCKYYGGQPQQSKKCQKNYHRDVDKYYTSLAEDAMANENVCTKEEIEDDIKKCYLKYECYEGDCLCERESDDNLRAVDAKGTATVGSTTCKWMEQHDGSKRGILINGCKIGNNKLEANCKYSGGKPQKPPCESNYHRDVDKYYTSLAKDAMENENVCTKKEIEDNIKKCELTYDCVEGDCLPSQERESDDNLEVKNVKGTATVGSTTCKWMESHDGSKRGIHVYKCKQGKTKLAAKCKYSGGQPQTSSCEKKYHREIVKYYTSLAEDAMTNENVCTKNTIQDNFKKCHLKYDRVFEGDDDDVDDNLGYDEPIRGGNEPISTTVKIYSPKGRIKKANILIEWM